MKFLILTIFLLIPLNIIAAQKPYEEIARDINSQLHIATEEYRAGNYEAAEITLVDTYEELFTGSGMETAIKGPLNSNFQYQFGTLLNLSKKPEQEEEFSVGIDQLLAEINLAAYLLDNPDKNRSFISKIVNTLYLFTHSPIALLLILSIFFISNIFIRKKQPGRTVQILFYISGVTTLYFIFIFSGEWIITLQAKGIVSLTIIPWIPESDLLKFIGIYPTAESLFPQIAILGIACVRIFRKAPTKAVAVET